MSVNLTLPGASRVFTGADWGISARTILNLNHLDSTSEHVVIHVPEDTLSVNLSYINALLGPSLEYLGPKAFEEKFSFTGRDISSTLKVFLKENSESTLENNSEPPVEAKHLLDFYLEKIALTIIVALLPLEAAGAALKEAKGEPITWQLICMVAQVILISWWILSREGNDD